MDKLRVREVFRELSRKLFILEGERKASKRKELINSILLSDEGEMKQLKELLNLEKE